MPLACTTCSAPLEEAQLDRSRGLARCRHCDTVVELDLSEPELQVRRPSMRTMVSMPTCFTWDNKDGALTVRWQWFSLKWALWAGFTVIWFLALGGYYADLLGPGGPGAAGLATQQLLFTAGHLLVGLVVAYMSAAGFFNTTTITAAHDSLTVQHGPLPWPGNGTVDGIRQLYSKERVHRGKHGRRGYSYELHAITDTGDERKLVSRLEEAPQALWLEQMFEEHLGIRDRLVGGELPRH